MIEILDGEIARRLEGRAGVWLFLDYDGTLAEFAPTPDDILPDAGLIEIITRLVQNEHTRVTILSGRRLAHIHSLLPVPGIILAGTYGIEIQDAGGPLLRVDAGVIRPVLDEIKAQWAQLIAGRAGFYLEDKGSALALHARYAPDVEAQQALDAARTALEPARRRPELFRILNGYKFLEVGPAQAGKGSAIDYLLKRYAWPESVVVYLGDDDKDEAAFQAVRAHGGVTVLVAPEPRPTQAEYRLQNPAEVRAWLSGLPALVERFTSSAA